MRACLPHDREGGADTRDDAAARRERHRQGSAGARAAHAEQPRAEAASSPSTARRSRRQLLESELFGYEKGAFTGAIKQTPGKFETANGGTLFLDEIGDMPLALQAKLLRFLQERVVERVGGREAIPVDVRVVCATNRDLQASIAAGQFRQDLFYRISEVTVQIPPLRDARRRLLVIAHAAAGRERAQSTGARCAASRRRDPCAAGVSRGRATCASSKTRSTAR